MRGSGITRSNKIQSTVKKFLLSEVEMEEKGKEERNSGSSRSSKEPMRLGAGSRPSLAKNIKA